MNGGGNGVATILPEPTAMWTASSGGFLNGTNSIPDHYEGFHTCMGKSLSR